MEVQNSGSIIYALKTKEGMNPQTGSGSHIIGFPFNALLPI